VTKKKKTREKESAEKSKQGEKGGSQREENRHRVVKLSRVRVSQGGKEVYKRIREKKTQREKMDTGARGKIHDAGKSAATVKLEGKGGAGKKKKCESR